jgi:hypothetical protein
VPWRQDILGSLPAARTHEHRAFCRLRDQRIRRVVKSHTHEQRECRELVIRNSFRTVDQGRAESYVECIDDEQQPWRGVSVARVSGTTNLVYIGQYVLLIFSVAGSSILWYRQRSTGTDLILHVGVYSCFRIKFMHGAPIRIRPPRERECRSRTERARARRSGTGSRKRGRGKDSWSPTPRSHRSRAEAQSVAPRWNQSVPRRQGHSSK